MTQDKQDRTHEGTEEAFPRALLWPEISWGIGHKG